MNKFWISIIKLFSLKFKKSEKTVSPINNFNDWTMFEMEIAVMLNLVRENRKPVSVIKNITGLFNAEHKEIPQLIPNQACWEAARKRCEVQFDREEISHDGVEVAFNVLKNEGYTHTAEILASGSVSPESITGAWFKSFKTRTIILETKYKYFGVGVREHKGRKYYCVLFAK